MDVDMTLNYKICKAIQKGLNEALANLSIDDFDNVEIDHKSENYEDVDLQHGKEEYEKWKFTKDNFIDLGLSSGTLWCNHNLGATCKRPAKSWAGTLYWWGDLVPYNDPNVRPWSQVANIDELPLNYDIAYQTNHMFRIPTKEQCEELCKLPHEWINDYNGIKGLRGVIFTGANGNHLFLPAWGWYDDYNGKIKHLRKCGSIMSREKTKNKQGVSYIEFDGPYVDEFSALANTCYVNGSDDWVHPIRPVLNK